MKGSIYDLKTSTIARKVREDDMPWSRLHKDSVYKLALCPISDTAIALWTLLHPILWNSERQGYLRIKLEDFSWEHRRDPQKDIAAMDELFRARIMDKTDGGVIFDVAMVRYFDAVEYNVQHHGNSHRDTGVTYRDVVEKRREEQTNIDESALTRLDATKDSESSNPNPMASVSTNAGSCEPVNGCQSIAEPSNASGGNSELTKPTPESPLPLPFKLQPWADEQWIDDHRGEHLREQMLQLLQRYAEKNPPVTDKAKVERWLKHENWKWIRQKAKVNKSAGKLTPSEVCQRYADKIRTMPEIYRKNYPEQERLTYAWFKKNCPGDYDLEQTLLYALGSVEGEDVKPLLKWSRERRHKEDDEVDTNYMGVLGIDS
jgi:hypothetical protein